MSQVIDYHTTPFEDVVSDYDAVLDVMGGDYEIRTFDPAHRVLAKNGHYLNIFNDGWAKLYGPQWVPVLVAKNYVLAKFNHWLGRGPAYDLTFVQPCSRCLERISKLVARGVLKPLVAKIVPWSELPAALAALETEHVRGKIVVTVPKVTKSA